MKQIYNVPENATDGFTATFSVRTYLTKIKARRKCAYEIHQISLDEVKGDVTKAVEPFWTDILRDVLLRGPYGERFFSQGELHIRTVGEDGVLYVMAYAQDITA